MWHRLGRAYRWRMATGTVAFWRDEEGWGAISAPGHPGLGFAHFSHIRAEGYRTLHKGQRVEYEYSDDLAQDGCQWRVEWVRALRDAEAS